MKSDNRAAMQIIGGHLLQAVARGDTAAVYGHLLVYQAILKAAEQAARAGE